MEATAPTTTSGNAPAVSTADQARIAAALEASLRRQHHPRLSLGVGRVAVLGHRARPPGHAGSGRSPSPPTSRTAPSRAPASPPCAWRAPRSAQRTASAAPTIRAGIRAFCRCSRACRAPARAAAAGRCRASIGAPPISPRASPRTAADHSPASAMRHSSRSCRDALLRVSEAAALDVADVQRQADGSGTVTVTGSKTDQEGRGHVRYLGAPTMQRLSAWLSGAGIVNGGPLFRQVLKDGATVTGRLGARSIRAIIARRAADAGIAGRVSGHSLRVGSAQSLAAAGAGLVELQGSGRLAGAHHAGALRTPPVRRTRRRRQAALPGEPVGGRQGRRCTSGVSKDKRHLPGPPPARATPIKGGCPELSEQPPAILLHQ